MDVLYVIISISLILVALFILVLFITTLSLYNETTPKNITNFEITFLDKLAFSIKNNDNKIDDNFIYNNIINNIPNNISYYNAVEILTVQVKDEYIPNSEIADLLKRLHSHYIKFDASNLFTSLLNKYLANIKITTDKEKKTIINAA